MRPTVLLLAVGLGAVASCAMLRREPPEPRPEDRLGAALGTLDRGDYAGAAQQLERLRRTYPGEPVAAQALLALAAIELDPRNPTRDLDAGAGLMAEYLGTNDSIAGTEEPAEVLYLLSLELGAAEQRASQAEASADSAQAVADSATTVAPETPPSEGAPTHALPVLPGPPITARIRELEATRDSLSARVKRLQGEIEQRDRAIAERDKQLEDTQQELRRIRRILKP